MMRSSSQNQISHWVFGFGGNDVIRILNGHSNRLDPGTGNNRIYGGSGTDTYVIGRGYGTNIITAGDHRSVIGTARDLLVFRDGITPDEVFLIRRGDDLEIHIVDANTDNIVIFVDFFIIIITQRQIVSITFGDGSVWSRQDLLNMVG